MTTTERARAAGLARRAAHLAELLAMAAEADTPAEDAAAVLSMAYDRSHTLDADLADLAVTATWTDTP